MTQAGSHYTLREWERRGIGERPDAVPIAHARALMSAASKQDKPKASIWPGLNRRHVELGTAPEDEKQSALYLGHNYIKARDHVGQISAPGCSLEILPKIGDLEGEGSVRTRLVQMLGVASGVDILCGAKASHGQQKETLLDILIRLFARGLLDQVRRGLPRAYISHEEDRPALRGRLNVNRQFSILAASPQSLACRFDELSFDIALNQIMAATVRAMRPRTQTFETRRLLDEIAFAYADIPSPPPSVLPWDRVHFDRSNTRWKDLHSLARLLMTQAWQTTGTGQSQGTALFFDMNKLFEAYVARRFASAVPKGWSATTQGGAGYCLQDLQTQRDTFQTKPDILIHEKGNLRLVIDTKWKTLLPVSTDPKRGISQADVYQMMAYSSLYKADAMLLYPWHAECGGTPGEIIACHKIKDDSGRQIQIACIDVSSNRTTAQAAELISKAIKRN